MKIKFKILAIFGQIIVLFYILNFFWQFLTQKGDLNILISGLVMFLIGLFWLPSLFKQIKHVIEN